MKMMTCKQLGGACDVEFRADSFEEMEALSKAHGMAMFEAGDAAHLEAMHKIRDLMTSPEAMRQWMAERRTAFEALPDME